MTSITKILNLRERQILLMRDQDHTRRQIGERFNLTTERVRQIELAARKRLAEAEAAEAVDEAIVAALAEAEAAVAALAAQPPEPPSTQLPWSTTKTAKRVRSLTWTNLVVTITCSTDADADHVEAELAYALAAIHRDMGTDLFPRDP